MNLKERCIASLREVHDDLRFGCSHRMFSAKEMIQELEDDTDHGKEHMKMMAEFEEYLGHEIGA